MYDFRLRAAKAGDFGGFTPRPAAAAAAARVLVAGGTPAVVGVVLGTGLGGLADRLTAAWSIPGRESRWLPPALATGHAGRIAGGTLLGVPVVMLQGRAHGYEGHAPEALSRGVELLAALGAETLLVTNASGGLRPDMTAGEVVVVTDHVDLVRRPWHAALVPAAAADVPRPPPYDPALVELATAAVRRAGGAVRRGVYAFLSGPSYETRAEYRLLRRIGADVVGMSTVPEVVAAAALGLETVVCSVVTNVARPDAAERTDAEDVCRMAATAEEGVWEVLVALARRAAGRAACGSC